MEKDNIKLEISNIKRDSPYLKKFLLEPDVLRYFPMVNEREVDDAVRIWISYAKQEACFTLLKNEIPIGICTIYPHYAKKILHQSLLSIIVTQQERGKGYGKYMLDYLEEVARNKFGMKLLHLEVYENNPAQRLYERQGYEVYGVHKNFLKEGDGIYKDKILMQKWIG